MPTIQSFCERYSSISANNNYFNELLKRVKEILTQDTHYISKVKDIFLLLLVGDDSLPPYNMAQTDFNRILCGEMEIVFQYLEQNFCARENSLQHIRAHRELRHIFNQMANSPQAILSHQLIHKFLMQMLTIDFFKLTEEEPAYIALEIPALLDGIEDLANFKATNTYLDAEYAVDSRREDLLIYYNNEFIAAGRASVLDAMLVGNLAEAIFKAEQYCQETQDNPEYYFRARRTLARLQQLQTSSFSLISIQPTLMNFFRCYLAQRNGDNRTYTSSNVRVAFLSMFDEKFNLNLDHKILVNIFSPTDIQIINIHTAKAVNLNANNPDLSSINNDGDLFSLAITPNLTRPYKDYFLKFQHILTMRCTNNGLPFSIKHHFNLCDATKDRVFVNFLQTSSKVRFSSLPFVALQGKPAELFKLAQRQTVFTHYTNSFTGNKLNAMSYAVLGGRIDNVRACLDLGFQLTGPNDRRIEWAGNLGYHDIKRLLFNLANERYKLHHYKKIGDPVSYERLMQSLYGETSRGFLGIFHYCDPFKVQNGAENYYANRQLDKSTSPSSITFYNSEVYRYPLTKNETFCKKNFLGNLPSLDTYVLVKKTGIDPYLLSALPMTGESTSYIPETFSCKIEQCTYQLAFDPILRDAAWQLFTDKQYQLMREEIAKFIRFYLYYPCGLDIVFRDFWEYMIEHINEKHIRLFCLRPIRSFNDYHNVFPSEYWFENKELNPLGYLHIIYDLEIKSTYRHNAETMRTSRENSIHTQQIVKIADTTEHRFFSTRLKNHSIPFNIEEILSKTGSSKFFPSAT